MSVWARELEERNYYFNIYKSFARPHLDYGDITYDKACAESFKSKLESVQYHGALAITGAINGSSRRKYQELGLESLGMIFFIKLKLNHLHISSTIKR